MPTSIFSDAPADIPDLTPDQYLTAFMSASANSSEIKRSAAKTQIVSGLAKELALVHHQKRKGIKQLTDGQIAEFYARGGLSEIAVSQQTGSLPTKSELLKGAERVFSTISGYAAIGGAIAGSIPGGQVPALALGVLAGSTAIGAYLAGNVLPDILNELDPPMFSEAAEATAIDAVTFLAEREFALEPETYEDVRRENNSSSVPLARPKAETRREIQERTGSIVDVTVFLDESDNPTNVTLEDLEALQEQYLMEVEKRFEAQQQWLTEQFEAFRKDPDEAALAARLVEVKKTFSEVSGAITVAGFFFSQVFDGRQAETFTRVATAINNVWRAKQLFSLGQLGAFGFAGAVVGAISLISGSKRDGLRQIQAGLRSISEQILDVQTQLNQRLDDIENLLRESNELVLRSLDEIKQGIFSLSKLQVAESQLQRSLQSVFLTQRREEIGNDFQTEARLFEIEAVGDAGISEGRFLGFCHSSLNFAIAQSRLPVFNGHAQYQNQNIWRFVSELGPLQLSFGLLNRIGNQFGLNQISEDLPNPDLWLAGVDRFLGCSSLFPNRDVSFLAQEIEAAKLDGKVLSAAFASLNSQRIYAAELDALSSSIGSASNAVADVAKELYGSAWPIGDIFEYDTGQPWTAVSNPAPPTQPGQTVFLHPDLDIKGLYQPNLFEVARSLGLIELVELPNERADGFERLSFDGGHNAWYHIRIRKGPHAGRFIGTPYHILYENYVGRFQKRFLNFSEYTSDGKYVECCDGAAIRDQSFLFDRLSEEIRVFRNWLLNEGIPNEFARRISSDVLESVSIAETRISYLRNLRYYKISMDGFAPSVPTLTEVSDAQPTGFGDYCVATMIRLHSTFLNRHNDSQDVSSLPQNTISWGFPEELTKVDTPFDTERVTNSIMTAGAFAQRQIEAQKVSLEGLPGWGAPDAFDSRIIGLALSQIS